MQRERQEEGEKIGGLRLFKVYFCESCLLEESPIVFRTVSVKVIEEKQKSGFLSLQMAYMLTTTKRLQ